MGDDGDVGDDGNDSNDNDDQTDNLLGLKIWCASVLHFVLPPYLGRLHAGFEYSPPRFHPDYLKKCASVHTASKLLCAES